MVSFFDLYSSSRAQEAVVPGAKTPSTYMSVAVGCFAAVGGFIYGYDTGIINSISEMAFVRHQFASNQVSFTAKESSIMTAILSLGTFFGALFAPVLSDTVGRRYSIIISSFFVFMVGNICQIASTTILLFCIGRFITGVSVGIISAVVPLYQAEASTKNFRGAIISTYQWAITWGFLVSSAVSQGTHSKNSSMSYRLPIGLQFLWSLILGTGMIFLPESPRFCVLKDDLNGAAESLSRLRRVPLNDPGLIEELVDIKASHDYELSFGTHSFKDCFKSDRARPHQMKRLLTGIFIMAIQQCSGINFIFYYGTNFFSKTGLSQYYLISFITYAVNVVATIPGILLVEALGRRKLLIIGGTLMAIANLTIAIVGVTTNSVIANKIMIALVCVFIASFAASWGPITWVVCGEIFSLGVRGKSVAISASSNWIVNFVFAYITPYLVDTGTHTAALGTKIFFIWGGFNVIGVCFVYLTVYETKGLSLEEIDELYRSCSSARRSVNFKVVLNFNNDQNGEDTPEKEDDVTNAGTSDKRVSSSNGSSLPEPYYKDPTHIATNFNTDYEDYNPNYAVDLGNGLGLAGQNRGPPSLLTVSTDEDSHYREDEDMRSNDITYSSLSEYVSRLSSGTGQQRRFSNQTGSTNNSPQLLVPEVEPGQSYNHNRADSFNNEAISSTNGAISDENDSQNNNNGNNNDDIDDNDKSKKFNDNNDDTNNDELLTQLSAQNEILHSQREEFLARERLRSIQEFGDSDSDGSSLFDR